MKKNAIILLVFINTIVFGQVQIGSDIIGSNSFKRIGKSVALSANGEILAIGAHDFDNQRNGIVRTYQKSGNNWVQIGNDFLGEAQGDNLGCSISLSSDGTVIAIGAFGGINNGYVRIYRYSSSTNNWVQIDVDIVGQNNSEYFGNVVSLSSNGDTVAIGASHANFNTVFKVGRVCIYKLNNSTWQKVGADIFGSAAIDYSGRSVSLSSDGTIVAIGAANNDQNGIDSGQARIFQYSNNNWNQIGNDIYGQSQGDQLGHCVSLSADGSIVAVSAPYDDNENGLNTGQIRVFKNISNTWTQIGSDIIGESIDDKFGTSISLSADGTILAIGSPDIGIGGSATIFKNNANVWMPIGNSMNADEQGDVFCFDNGMCLSSDGSTLAMGSVISNIYLGEVKVFDLTNVLSLENLKPKETVVIYPNPTNSILNINSNVTISSIELYDIQGRTLETNFVNEMTSLIDISSKPNGIYLLKIITEQGNKVERIIKI